jgi:hypothetical protein
MSKDTDGTKSRPRDTAAVAAGRKITRPAKLKSSDWYENAARSLGIQSRRAREHGTQPSK